MSLLKKKTDSSPPSLGFILNLLYNDNKKLDIWDDITLLCYSHLISEIVLPAARISCIDNGVSVYSNNDDYYSSPKHIS